MSRRNHVIGMSRIKARFKSKVMLVLISKSNVMKNVISNTGEKYIIHFRGLRIVFFKTISYWKN